MPDLGKQLAFVELLESCRQIVVPRLQRDYAQGRETAKEVRDGFLDALHEALVRPIGDRPPLNLDFVYGSMEEDGGKHFLPLDGQQRLTTLYLLHGYLAWRDGASSDFQGVACDGQRSRFSYAVRPSSTEFLDELVRFSPGKSSENETSVRALVENQPWFYLHWRLDPTVQSALTMLDAIHLRFASCHGLFARLLDKERPAITFQLLPLEHFGLSDDLYIKMNARGKPLTPFETFKARFEEHLKQLYPTERREIGGASVPVHDFFSRRMDTRWTDFFWGYRTTESAIFDTAVMSLFWIVAWVSIDPERSSGDGSPVTRYRDGVGSYTDFHELKLLTKTFADNLICLLEAWSKGGGKLTSQLPQACYFAEAAFFEKARTAPTKLEYGELVMFAAFASYLRSNEGNVDAAEFQEWMRVVSNLVRNSDIERPEDFERSLGGITKLLPHSRQILQHLANADVKSLGFNQQQFEEESLKAKLLSAQSGWISRIHVAEEHGYFQGQIDFLLSFSGVNKRATEQPVVAWPAAWHEELQLAFDVYLAKAQLTFDSAGVAAKMPRYQWQRALLAIGDYLMPGSRNRSFLTNPSRNWDSWKRFLRGSRREHLRQLWDRIDLSVDIQPQLAGIIGDTGGLEAWRAAVVSHPEVIGYCEQREIRQESWSPEIYLLRKKQMNGAHAELFSFALHCELSDRPDWLDPLELGSYHSVTMTDEEPYFSLSCLYRGHSLVFIIRSSKGRFEIFTSLADTQKVKHLENSLRDDCGFSEESRVLIRRVPREQIRPALRQIAEACEGHDD
jgi:hypothetical protein